MGDDQLPMTDQFWLMEQIRAATKGCDCVIVVPPFASIARPALGPHILQQMAQLEGLRVSVLYSNLIFARLIGVELYERVCDQTSRSWLIGERIFARAAHGIGRFGAKEGALPGVDLETAQRNPCNDSAGTSSSLPKLNAEDLDRIETETLTLCGIVSSGLSTSDCRVIGATTSFEQTNAALAVLRSVKDLVPGVVTLLGGANCEAEMGKAMLDLASGAVDLVFSGESEQTFPSALREIIDGGVVRRRLIEGAPCDALDCIPCPEFGEYFSQLGSFMPAVDQESCWLMYETSRGCWWGQKHHCTFCGLNGEGMAFRQKSPAKVIRDVTYLFEKYPPKHLAMTDNIMPHSYHRSLLPQLALSDLDRTIFYEQKSNLSLKQVKALHDAGVRVIQPGIEALSTSLLGLMQKGVCGSQNIGLLRYARACAVALTWNLLVEFPNDSIESYLETLEIVPYLRHLNPPSGVTPLSIDRFSPYFDQSFRYGIADLRPWLSYFDVFPGGSDVDQLAYHFQGEYESDSRKDVDTMSRLEKEVTAWRDAWTADAAPPALAVSQLDLETYVLIDTREFARPHVKFLSACQARAVLAELPLSSPDAQWAIVNNYALRIDGKSVPLAIGSYELMSKFSEAGAVFQGSEDALGVSPIVNLVARGHGVGNV
jgi:ribosomal peptide maturation radical SAM protein 1